MDKAEFWYELEVHKRETMEEFEALKRRVQNLENLVRAQKHAIDLYEEQDNGRGDDR